MTTQEARLEAYEILSELISQYLEQRNPEQAVVKQLQGLQKIFDTKKCLVEENFLDICLQKEYLYSNV